MRKTRSGTDVHFSGLGRVAIVTGIGSFFYHASETWIGAIADYLGMYLGSTYMLTMNIHRYFSWSARVRTIIYWAVLSVLLLTMVFFPNISRIVYGTTAAVSCIGLESLIYLRNRKVNRVVQYRWLLGVWLLFMLAYVVWILDESRVTCDPRNHYFNGHALWHVLNAVNLYFLFCYYQQYTWMNSK